MHGLFFTDFHETHKPHRMTCGKCQQKSIYAYKRKVAFAPSIFTKLIITEGTFVDLPRAELYPNRAKM
jgi:hypothetical protein